MRSVALHLLPGVALTAFYVAAAPLATRWGFPPVFALLVGIPLVVVPAELGYLLYQARRTSGTWSLATVVPYRDRLARRKHLVLSLSLLVWFLVAATISLVEPRIIDTLFSWLPGWYVDPLPVDQFSRLSSTPLVVFVACWLAFNGAVGPVVEELYFRGHLLPAIDRLGSRAVALNTVLFSLYHLWSPWANPTRIVSLLPLVYIVWRTRNVYVGITVHVAVNTVGMLLTLGAIR